MTFDIQNPILPFELRQNIKFCYSKFGLNSNVKKGFGMSEYDIRPQFECQNRTTNVKIRFSISVRMSK